MNMPEPSRAPAAANPECRRRPRWRGVVVASVLALGTVLSGCDSKGKPVEPEVPAADPNLLAEIASSERFVVERDREQTASSDAFVLIREEARNAPN